MPRDHFLARTYLKHFGDAAKGGLLHAYRKNGGPAFTPGPAAVCKVWDDT